MKSFTLKAKFITLWVSIILIISLLGIVANYKAAVLKEKFEETNKQLAQQDLLNQTIAECLQTGQALRNIFIDYKDKKALENLGMAINNIDTLNKNLYTLNKGASDELKSEFEMFFGNTKALYNQAMNGKPYESAQIVENTNHWREYKKKLKSAIQASDEKAETVKKDLQDFIFVSITQMILGLLVAIGSISIVLYAINRQILSSTKAIQSGLMNFFDFLGNKTDEFKKIELHTKDEFGDMATAINESIAQIRIGLEKDAKTVASAVVAANAIKSGNISLRVTESPNNPQLAELKTVFNDMLDVLNENIANILAVLRLYAQNDFTKRVEPKNLEAQLLELVGGVNELGHEIEDMLGKNLENGLALRHSASVLKNFVESLASASNEQAASLEETSAALEEITSNISSNTEKAIIMAQKAKEAKSATESGEEMATKTVVSMQEIEKATNAINNAVAIIENIAFQTNILSLNAAVEAATAGEAGKGFAVVAQEVRNLASKSAEAAKTIQVLTNEAKNKAKDGTDISQHMIEGFRSIAQKIGETVELVNDVASANKEQMAGIEQINDAVAQLDQMTQENARVANSTDSVSLQVADMADKLTTEASQKIFKNKESIISSARQLEYNDAGGLAAPRQLNSSFKKILAKPHQRAQIPSHAAQKLESKKTGGDDMWESF